MGYSSDNKDALSTPIPANLGSELFVSVSNELEFALTTPTSKPREWKHKEQMETYFKEFNLALSMLHSEYIL